MQDIKFSGPGLSPVTFSWGPAAWRANDPHGESIREPHHVHQLCGGRRGGPGMSGHPRKGVKGSCFPIHLAV